jgi:hypothetical protein
VHESTHVVKSLFFILFKLLSLKFGLSSIGRVRIRLAGDIGNVLLSKIFGKGIDPSPAGVNVFFRRGPVVSLARNRRLMAEKPPA